MECKESGGTLLADYAFGVLASEMAEEVKSHLDICASCREEAETIRKVATALDGFEQEHKSLVFYDLDESGLSVIYSSVPGEHGDRKVSVDRSDPSDLTSNARLMNPRHCAWIFRPGVIVKDPGEWDVRVEAVRMPAGAKLLSCSPQADETYAGGRTALVWRRVLSEWEIFGLVVVYELKT